MSLFRAQTIPAPAYRDFRVTKTVHRPTEERSALVQPTRRIPPLATKTQQTSKAFRATRAARLPRSPPINGSGTPGARVAGGQDYEIRDEARKTGQSKGDR